MSSRNDTDNSKSENHVQKISLCERLENALGADPYEEHGAEAVIPRAFATALPYVSAPNPMLVAGEQNVGVPLTAEHAASALATAPKDSGLGWVMPTNENFTTWVRKNILSLADTELGVKECSITPRCNGSPVFITEKAGEPGFDFLDSASPPRSAFGRAMVILPCNSPYELALYTGRLEPDPAKRTTVTARTVIANTAQERARTVAAAWYSGTSQRLKIEAMGGFCVVLFYDLLYTGKLDALPTLPNNSSAFEKAQETIARWNEYRQACEAVDYSGQVVPDTIVWVLDQSYSMLSAKTVFTGTDKHRVQILREAMAKGMRLFAAKMTLVRIGEPNEEFDHYYNEPSPDPEEWREMTMNEGAGVSNTVSLTYAVDLTTGNNLPPELPDISIDFEDPRILPEGWLQDVIEGDHEVARGSCWNNEQLTNEYDLTALVLFPSGAQFAKMATELSFHVALLLDKKYWPDGEGARFEFAENFIKNLPQLDLPESTKPDKYGYGYGSLQDEKEKHRARCTNILLQLALDNKRLDLLNKVIASLGTHDRTWHQRALENLGGSSADGVDDFVRTAAHKEKNIVGKIEVLMSSYGKDSEKAAVELEKLLKSLPSVEGGLAKLNANPSEQLDAISVLNLETCVGKEGLRDCIFPKLRNHHDTEYWLELLTGIQLRRAQDSSYYSGLLDVYLPEVVAAHVYREWNTTLRLFRFCLDVNQELVLQVFSKIVEDEPKALAPVQYSSYGYPRQPEPRTLESEDPTIHHIRLSKVKALANALRQKQISLLEYGSYFQNYFAIHIMPFLGPRPSIHNTDLMKNPVVKSYAIPTIEEHCGICREINEFLRDKRARERKFAVSSSKESHVGARTRKHPHLEYSYGAVVKKVAFVPEELLQEWELARTAVRECAEDLRDALGELWPMISTATAATTGPGWTIDHVEAAIVALRPKGGPLVATNANENKRKAESDNPEGQAKKRGLKIIDLTDEV